MLRRGGGDLLDKKAAATPITEEQEMKLLDFLMGNKLLCNKLTTKTLTNGDTVGCTLSCALASSLGKPDMEDDSPAKLHRHLNPCSLVEYVLSQIVSSVNYAGSQAVTTCITTTGSCGSMNCST